MNDWACLSVAILDGERSLYVCLSSKRKQRDMRKTHRRKGFNAIEKWCDVATAKKDGNCKRRKCEDGSHMGSSQAIGTETGEEDQVSKRPMGVKAAKARGKRTMVEEKDLEEFHSMWRIKREDLAAKERLTKMRLLNSLIAKKELAEYEEELKKKLINELLSN
ncbi:hypothetical protein Bca52824_060881 [Brassica carinata]|uniref:No apical meristem-associated C-terminal domain-containing protein n=1 Tax=Brassica carinata TaxID=52824 RepID=A0A8X7UI13_BRACI|nr:hypothetical protein Bca52824_060881 [Brassica carinata]